MKTNVINGGFPSLIALASKCRLSLTFIEAAKRIQLPSNRDLVALQISAVLLKFSSFCFSLSKQPWLALVDCWSRSLHQATGTIASE